MEETVRTRNQTLGRTSGRRWFTVFGESAGHSNVNTLIVGPQKTVSTGHPFPSQLGSGEDLGGDFLTIRRRLGGDYVSKEDKHGFVNRNYVPDDERNHRPEFRLVSPNLNPTYHYVGQLWPVAPTALTGFPPPLYSSENELIVLGTNAIDKVKPTNSAAELAVGFAELFRDGLPSIPGIQLWRSRASNFRELSRSGGSEYLNVEFGWKPFVDEVRSALSAVKGFDRILGQLERDNGRNVRRQMHFPSSDVTTEATFSGRGPWASTGLSPYHFTGLNGTQGTLVRRRRIRRQQWFSGAFTYHIPMGNTWRDRVRRTALQADHLLGLSLTPETLWSLSPWSWFVDWFFNVGPVISNVSDWATYGLVMRYGYMMEHTIITDTYTLSGTGLIGGPQQLDATFHTEVKQRIKATPFGFGLDWSGFDSWQLSILAALGMTRGRSGS